MTDYPRPITPEGLVEPVPRRIRARLGDRWVVDSTAALYMWEKPWYPTFAFPEEDVQASALPAGAATPAPGREGHILVEWDAPDEWYEEDEQVFVHPRSPYVRVDALRSSRHVSVELEGLLLAESSAPVIVFETGLPPRYYFERPAVHTEHLRPSDTVTECPYKGTTSEFWSVEAPSGLEADLAWGYDFPTRQLLPIAGMIAFYNEKVDISVDGVREERPETKFS